MAFVSGPRQVGKTTVCRAFVRYVRDKLKREVDFLVIRDGKPWFLAEARIGDQRLSPSLDHFRTQLGCEHTFQIVMDLPYVEQDCFAYHDPVLAPARTFLSQLL